MFKPLLLTAIMTPLFIACGSGEELSETNIIIGENTLSYYSANDQYSQAIGKMARGCTATHIGNGYVLTAGHCVESFNCRSSDYNVTWNYRDNNRSGDFTSSCTEVVAKELNNLRDFAILKYDETPQASFPLNTTSRPKQGDKLTILSHPEGVPLAWSGWCQHEGDFGEMKFSYKCDTKGGSSGAVVLNENLEVVGIHNLGSQYYNKNAGTYLMDIPSFQR